MKKMVMVRLVGRQLLVAIGDNDNNNGNRNRSLFLMGLRMRNRGEDRRRRWPRLSLFYPIQPRAWAPSAAATPTTTPGVDHDTTEAA